MTSARTVSARRPRTRIIFPVSSNSSGVAGTAFEAGETGPAMSSRGAQFLPELSSRL